jgi:hypothetical protein
VVFSSLEAQSQEPHHWPMPKNREMVNGCTSTRMVVPPTIGVEPLVAPVSIFIGHTSFMVRTIGAYAQKGRNPR